MMEKNGDKILAVPRRGLRSNDQFGRRNVKGEMSRLYRELRNKLNFTLPVANYYECRYDCKIAKM